MDFANMYNDAVETTPVKRVRRTPAVIPDGNYTGKVIEFGVFTDTTPNSRTWCSFWFEVVGGEHAGGQVERFFEVKAPTMKWLVGDLRKLLGRAPAWPEIATNTNPVDYVASNPGTWPVYRTGEVQGQVEGLVAAIAQKTTVKGANTYVDIFIDGLAPAAAAVEAPSNGAPQPHPDAPAPADADFLDEEAPF